MSTTNSVGFNSRDFFRVIAGCFSVAVVLRQILILPLTSLKLSMYNRWASLTHRDPAASASIINAKLKDTSYHHSPAFFFFSFLEL